MSQPDAVVVGSGPNGLAAALTLARAGLTVQVLEGAPTPGGGCRTAELTLPGFAHDVCSTVHALAVASPFFAGSDLAGRGVRMLTPKVAAAHPLDGGRAGAVSGSVAETAARLGDDARAYERLIAGLVRADGSITSLALAPLRTPALRSFAAKPIPVVQFGVEGLQPATLLARRLHTPEGRALLAGMTAHAIMPLSAPLTSAFGLTMLVLAHTTGWPVVEGGSGQLIRAMTSELAERGGSVVTGTWVEQLSDLPPAKAILLDVTPRQLLGMAGDRLPSGYRRAMQRFRYGAGVCKVDWALDGPVPWLNEECRQTVTVHVGGTITEVARSEAAVAAGQHPERPFCIIAQPSVVDASRAPAGRHVVWGYCHVPAGVRRRHDRADRSADRAVRAGLPRPDPGQVRDDGGRRGTLQPRLCGRRYRRRGQHAAADCRASDAAVESLPDAAARRVPMLGIDATWRRRARDVRLLGGGDRAARSAPAG